MSNLKSKMATISDFFADSALIKYLGCPISLTGIHMGDCLCLVITYNIDPPCAPLCRSSAVFLILSAGIMAYKILTLQAEIDHSLQWLDPSHARHARRYVITPIHSRKSL